MKKHLLSKILGAICSVAILCAGYAVNSTCASIIYEPKMPKEAEALRKIK